jgi:hypothetical protein
MKNKVSSKSRCDIALGHLKIEAVPQINLYKEPKLNAQDLTNFYYYIDVISTNV